MGGLVRCFSGLCCCLLFHWGQMWPVSLVCTLETFWSDEWRNRKKNWWLRHKVHELIIMSEPPCWHVYILVCIYCKAASLLLLWLTFSLQECVLFWDKHWTNFSARPCGKQDSTDYCRQHQVRRLEWNLSLRRITSQYCGPRSWRNQIHLRKLNPSRNKK